MVLSGILPEAGLPSRADDCLTEFECAECADVYEEGSDGGGISYSEARRLKSIFRSHAQITPSRPPEYLEGGQPGSKGNEGRI